MYLQTIISWSLFITFSFQSFPFLSLPLVVIWNKLSPYNFSIFYKFRTPLVKAVNHSHLSSNHLDNNSIFWDNLTASILGSQHQLQWLSSQYSSSYIFYVCHLCAHDIKASSYLRKHPFSPLHTHLWTRTRLSAQHWNFGNDTSAAVSIEQVIHTLERLKYGTSFFLEQGPVKLELLEFSA